MTVLVSAASAPVAVLVSASTTGFAVPVVSVCVSATVFAVPVAVLVPASATGFVVPVAVLVPASATGFVVPVAVLVLASATVFAVFVVALVLTVHIKAYRTISALAGSVVAVAAKVAASELIALKVQIVFLFHISSDKKKCNMFLLIFYSFFMSSAPGFSMRFTAFPYFPFIADTAPKRGGRNNGYRYRTEVGYRETETG